MFVLKHKRNNGKMQVIPVVCLETLNVFKQIMCNTNLAYLTAFKKITVEKKPQRPNKLFQ